LALRKIGSRTHIDNDSILDPKGLAFDKLSGKRIEESTIGENGIWRRVTGNGLIVCQHLIHLFHMPLGTDFWSEGYLVCNASESVNKLVDF
jgi:hypothetical protein